MKNNKMTQQKLAQKITISGKKQKWLVMVGSALSCCFVISPAVNASDIEIYRQGSNGGNSTVMLMVDTSQTMGSPALDLLKDYPLCISGKIFGVVGALPVVDVKLTPPAGTEAYCDVIFPKSVLDLLGTVDTITGTGRNSLLGLQSSLDYMRASCTPFSKLEAGEPVRSNKILSVNINLGEGYRCYSRLSRIRIAVKDVLDGNSGKGLVALPDKTVVGLSSFPAKKGNSLNQKAGMIAVPAKALDSTQRAALKAAMNNLVPSSDPLGSTLDSVVGILNSVLDGLNIAGLLTNVLSLIGNLPSTVVALLANQESATATAYAETGAYLLGKNTRGTGESLSEFESPVNKQTIAYKCLARQADNDCTGYEQTGILIKKPVEYNVPTYDRKVQVTTTNGVLGNLLGFLGLGNKDVIRYYNATDSIYSGYAYRADSVEMSGDNYVKPVSISGQATSPAANNAQCQAQGILVLTGNIPKIDPVDALGVQRTMQKSLGKAPTSDLASFCGASPAGWSSRGTATATWSCIANYSQALLDKNSSYRTQVEIKTGVAGIGKEFNYVRLDGDTVVGAGTGGSIVNDLLNTVKALLKTALSLVSIVVDLKPLLNLVDVILPTSPANTADVENLAYWGRDGKGGWYTEASKGGIAQSILDFSSHIVDAKSDPFMGLQSIPADPLTPYLLSNDVYNSIFVPSDQQSWYGNLKKYSVLTENETTGGNVIRLKGSVDFKDQWNGGRSEKMDGSELLAGGMLNQLNSLRPQKTDTSTRKLWINRDCQQKDSQYIFAESQALKAITPDYLSDSSESRCKDNLTSKDQYGGYLMNLLGYQVDPQTATGSSLTQSEPLWQLGMPLHSTPLKITQFAKFNTDGGIDRDDYIVFGSTQGLLHIVDADNGKERFAFVPNEMLENSEQRKAFTAQRQGTYRNMPYGVDGAWTAYTEYVYGMKDGKVIATVDQLGSDANKIQGKQVLYGGLRMGGRGYYALDLADLDRPKLKLHIDPDAAAVNTPLSYMGQSWSKPTVTYVNWRGQRKLVMLVGGGYDVGYEDKAYNPSRAKGAGVYMFDANNGELLWWASANAANKNEGEKAHGLNVATMQFSVVSRINAVDRDGNGLMDHFYFGDLGGQVWRIDLNTAMSTTDNTFTKRATRLINLHKADGSSPRFYDAPNFSVYGYAKPLAVLSIASGNRSLPISDERSGEIYNLFDRDVTRTDLYASSFTPLTKDVDLTTSGNSLRAILTAEEVKDKSVEQVKALMPNGWVVSFDPNASVGKDTEAGKGKKVLDEMAVVNKNLYASVYNPGDEPSCPVQVRGETKVHRYCLPFGVCEQKLQSGQVSTFLAGKGIIALNIGTSGTDSTSKLQSRGLIGTGTSDSAKMPTSQMRRKIVPLKWYENNEQ